MNPALFKSRKFLSLRKSGVKNKPIGVFDSGLGGLTVVRQLIKLLPGEDIIYLGDTARVPYGNKSKSTIIKFSVQNALYLLRHKVKLIVIACNTSSSFALSELSKNFKVPLVGVIEPGVKKAQQATIAKRIGIIGTKATIDSRAYQNRIKRQAPLIKVFAQSCPLFVPLIEEGWLNEEVTVDVIKKYLTPLKKNRIDALILGCTHYPLLKPSIKKVMGKNVRLVDSAKEVALSVKYLINDLGIASEKPGNGKVKFFLTDKPYRFKKIGEKFLGRQLKFVYLVKESDYYA